MIKSVNSRNPAAITFRKCTHRESRGSLSHQSPPMMSGWPAAIAALSNLTVVLAFTP